MTGLRFTVALAALNLALAACAPIGAPIRIDGDFHGTATRFQALNRYCPRPGLLNISVRNNVMLYKWGNQFMQVSVQSNGALAGALPGVQLTGTHDGTTIQGNITDGQCGLHFTLNRVGA